MLPIMNKVHRWEQVEQATSRITDALGCSIDAGILPVVVAFNALNATTEGSCEGHLDHGTLAPYIDFAADIDEQKLAEVMRKIFEAQQERKRGHLSDDLYYQRYHAAVAQEREIGLPHLKLRERVAYLLTQFYQRQHASQFLDRLILVDIQGSLSGIGVPFRLEPQGTSLQCLASPPQQAANLERYQREFVELGAFLKQWYFQQHDGERND